MTQLINWITAYAWHIGVTVGAILSLWTLIAVIWADLIDDDTRGGERA